MIKGLDVFDQPAGGMGETIGFDVANREESGRSIEALLARLEAIDAGRGLASCKALADAGHQPQRDEFPSPLVDGFHQSFFEVRRAILESVSDLSAEEQDEPGEIKADHHARLLIAGNVCTTCLTR
jgi:hypothetical protein